MIRKLKILIIPLILLYFNVSAQDYYRYQRIINAIDEDILNNHLKSALTKTDTIYKDYDFIYARHCIKALQISCELNDSLKAEIWLKKAFLQGVPKWIIYHNEITKKATAYENTQQVLADYNILHQQYLSKINLSIRKTVDSLRVLDKKYTDKVNLDNNFIKYVVYGLQWWRNSKKQIKVLKPLIKKYGFPGERLIGFIDTIYKSPNIQKRQWHNYISKSNAEVMFTHYFSKRRKHLNALLLPNVKSGYLDPYEYAGYNDFLGKWGKKRYNNFYYNVWHTDNDKSHLTAIEKRRAEIGLETRERQKEKWAIFLKRMKQKELNKTIIIENFKAAINYSY